MVEVDTSITDKVFDLIFILSVFLNLLAATFFLWMAIKVLLDKSVNKGIKLPKKQFLGVCLSISIWFFNDFIFQCFIYAGIDGFDNLFYSLGALLLMFFSYYAARFIGGEG